MIIEPVTHSPQYQVAVPDPVHFMQPLLSTHTWLQRGRKDREGVMGDVCLIVRVCRLENRREVFQRQVWWGRPPIAPTIFSMLDFDHRMWSVDLQSVGIRFWWFLAPVLHPMIRHRGSRCERDLLSSRFPFLICISSFKLQVRGLIVAKAD